jgi:hypothetical protein
MTTHANKAEEKQIYVVLGMARSGTSAIARGLQALGIPLGHQLTPGSQKWNPKGFFEDNDIVYKINRRVLHALDQSWMGVGLIEESRYKDDDIANLKKMANTLLQQRMASTMYWGFKDPRTAKILPFWQSLFADLTLNEHYLIALRNPLASACSYQRVTGTDVEVGLLLWMMHLIPAVEATIGKKRIMVSYEAMLKNPLQQLERIKQGLGIPDLAGQAERDDYANEFLDKKLQHYEYSAEHFVSHKAVAVVPLCVKMYELFLKAANDEMTLESEAFLSAWADIKQEFWQVYPTYRYMNVLLNKNKRLERHLRTIHKSLPWKLLYPLRIIDDALRARRRKTREQRRLIKSYG